MHFVLQIETETIWCRKCVVSWWQGDGIWTLKKKSSFQEDGIGTSFKWQLKTNFSPKQDLVIKATMAEKWYQSKSLFWDTEKVSSNSKLPIELSQGKIAWNSLNELDFPVTHRLKWIAVSK